MTEYSKILFGNAQFEECPACGSTIKNTCGKKPQKFCSDQCRYDYWKTHRNEINKKVYHKMNCAYCKKEFYSYSNPNRKYCSKECNGLDKRKVEMNDSKNVTADDTAIYMKDEKIAAILKEVEQDDPVSVCEAVLKLQAKGYSCSETAKILNRPKNTIKSWRHRYGKKSKAETDGMPSKTLTAKPTIILSLPKPLRYKNASTLEEWQDILRRQKNEDARLTGLAHMEGELSSEAKNVHLVCGGININKGVEGLTSIIQGRLGLNPFSDGLFVFCSKTFHQIKYVQWDGTGFLVCAKRLERGIFPWPDAKLGKYTTISKSEFRFLLAGATPKQYMAKQDFSKKIVV